METWELKIAKVEMLQRKYMEKNRSIARTVSIEAVLQPRFYYAMSYFSFDAEVLFAFFAFGDTFFTLGLMVHIGLGSDRRRLAGFSGRFSRSFTFGFEAKFLEIIVNEK